MGEFKCSRLKDSGKIKKWEYRGYVITSQYNNRIWTYMSWVAGHKITHGTLKGVCYLIDQHFKNMERQRFRRSKRIDFVPTAR